MQVLPSPRFLSLQINKSCNLRCTHCDYWQLNDGDRERYLSFSRRDEILEEFASMNPAGRVVICGGEPMLDLNAYFRVCGTCRDLGLRCLSVVNGTRIRSAEMAQRLIAEGPHEISISLNSHREALHDETRGVPGSFRKAVTAIRLLLEARNGSGREDPRINVMGLVFARNFREIEDFYSFVLGELGADKLKLNFVQPRFGQSGVEDSFFCEETDVDPEELERILWVCDEKFSLGFNPVWIRQASMYFRSLSADETRSRGWHTLGRTTEHICNSYDRNVMVDHYGFARLCFSSAFNGMHLKKKGDLLKFWTGADDIRCKMRKCNAYCGISHSVRKEASTIAGNAYAEEHARNHSTRVAAQSGRHWSQLFSWYA